MVHEDEVRAALAELGPFFAVEAAEAVGAIGTDGAASGGWRSMAELADGSDVSAARVAAVREVLARDGGQRADAVEERVAASVAHLGLVARLLSPYLALAVLYGRVPERVRLRDLRWRPVLGGPYPLALPPLADRGASAPCPRDAGGAPAAGTAPSPAPAPAPAPHGARPGAPRACPGPWTDLDAVADAFADTVCAGAVAEVGGAFRGFRVAAPILRGNVASAVNGAARTIGAARPEAAARARALAGLLLERGPLRGAGRLAPEGAFRRLSCCLIYRAAPGGRGALCGDCALSHVPVRPR
ncbi:hypothetical protein RVR_130 [Actinacidiphila reveromycinica]|uniref:Ferric siderophore reductase C-terminal domain-containing protein n=1 Tax=Actinacidiphila reveromycinica TaxID=659352 RepID=A0A7U3VL96_9ACTN|nr:(2Fe-2S)-binding protein [Streptomyces sp. SN-593]BBA95315.1 hypothetical protein RVR_130 [Streptomyces sp. SN-593]